MVAFIQQTIIALVISTAVFVTFYLPHCNA